MDTTVIALLSVLILLIVLCVAVILFVWTLTRRLGKWVRGELHSDEG